MHTHTTFCVLIFNPATLLNLLIWTVSFIFYFFPLIFISWRLITLKYCSGFLMESLKFSIYNIQSSTNSDIFTSSFLLLMNFTSFYFSIALARTPNTMLNKSNESGHPCFFLDFRLNVLSFSLLSVMLAVGLSYIYGLYYVEVQSIYM